MVINYRQQLVVCFSCSPSLVTVKRFDVLDETWKYLTNDMNDEKKMLLTNCNKPVDLFARPPLVVYIMQG